jgi:hypothetical protein
MVAALAQLPPWVQALGLAAALRLGLEPSAQRPDGARHAARVFTDDLVNALQPIGVAVRAAKTEEEAQSLRALC